MPAMNMAGTSAANPSTGKFVLMSPFSGPKGSPFDKDNATNTSTGALCTGIGFGGTQIIGPTAPQSIKDRGFTDDYQPGLSKPDGTLATDARFLAIGGGRCNATAGGFANPNPYAAQPLVAFGAGGSRDAGAGPAFTGFGLRMATATGAVAIGAAVETISTVAYNNRSPQAMVSGQSVFASSAAASPAVT